jgi:hypothetical protein
MAERLRLMTNAAGGIAVTGTISVTGTVDGVDIAARDAILTSTTTTAGAALPKAGGTITGALVTQGILTLDGVTSNNASDLLKLKFDNSPADTGIVFTDLDSTVKNRISMDSGNTNDMTISATTDMRFHTNSSTTANERMRITSAGNVGIGTIPESTIKVDVASGTNTRPMRLRFFDDNNGSTNNPLAFEYKAGLEIENAYSGASPSTNGTKIAKLQLTTVTSGGYGANASMFVTTNAGTGYNSGELGFSVGSNSSGLETEAMRINKDGNVGIGTDDPQAKLNISGSSENIRLDNTGTSNYGLEIWRGGNKGASVAWGEGNANLEIKNYRNDSQADGPYANIDFFTGGTNAPSPNYNPDLRMRIQQTGEVGIGTSNPTSKLHVDGTIVGFDGQTTKSVHTIGTNVGGFPRRRFFRHVATGSGDEVFKLMRYARHWWGIGNVEIIVRGVYYGGSSLLGHFTVNGHTRSGVASIASHLNNSGTNTPYADNYSSTHEACDISIIVPSYQQYFVQFNIVYQYVVATEAAVGYHVGQSNGIYLFPSVREFI